MNLSQFEEYTQRSEATISAKVLCDSVNPQGNRLTTMELTYPRCIHSEFMTHRMFSRNSASSRAIPIEKMIARVLENPFFPLHWGKNQKGMQAEEELSQEQKLLAGQEWITARDKAVFHLQNLQAIGIHKQLGNRIVEPWMWITVICSGTQWENFFALRCHPMAEPHIQNLAYKMRAVYDASVPQKLNYGQWHLPLIDQENLSDDSGMWNTYTPLHLAQISAGRCARVSYLTHDGKRDFQEDIKLYERLSSSVPLHASPLEHPAMVGSSYKPLDSENVSNFGIGWIQLRKMHNNENITKRI